MSKPALLGAIERAFAEMSWAPPEVTIIRRPEIVYCHSRLKNNFFNNVLRISAPPHDHPRLIDEVRGAHQGRRSRWSITPSSRTDLLLSRLSDAGYELTAEDEICARTTDGYEDPISSVRVDRVETMSALRDHFSVRQGLSEAPTLRLSDADFFQHLSVCEEGKKIVRFVAYDRDANRPVSAAMMTLHPSASAALLWEGTTVENFRGRGAYRALLHSRITYARNAGLAAVGVLANPTTSAPIVIRRGFQSCGRVSYWEREADPPTPQ